MVFPAAVKSTRVPPLVTISKREQFLSHRFVIVAFQGPFSKIWGYWVNPIYHPSKLRVNRVDDLFKEEFNHNYSEVPL